MFSDSDAVRITGPVSSIPRLQTGSTRRAVVNRIIDSGGTSSVNELDRHFGFSTRPFVAALIRVGWVEVLS